MKASFRLTLLFLGMHALNVLYSPAAFGKDEQTIAAIPRGNEAFHAREILTYDISWSNVFSAGTVTTVVEKERLAEGREVFRFVVTGRSVGVVDKVFPVNDRVESVYDPLLMQSLSYSLKESYGRRKRIRVMEFDPAKKTVATKLNEDPTETLTAPEHVQDSLSAFYYLRTKEDLVIGKHFDIDVVDGDKNWLIEVYVLGKETITTPAGAFATVKVKTHPLYKGVFMNKGEVYAWLTDDSRKIPVLMKGKIKVGSFVFTLMHIDMGMSKQ